MIEPRQLTADIVLRELAAGDGAALAAAYEINREHLKPWEPSRPPEYFDAEWQENDTLARLAAGEGGAALSLVLARGAAIVGRFNLGGIVRGPFQSAGLGYWVDGRCAGRGLASAAVSEIVRIARAELGLHRIEAGTLVHNAASQRVLQKAGFEQIGLAPRYLCIDGEWQDHRLFQLLLHN